jgi:hypothetical protein
MLNVTVNTATTELKKSQCQQMRHPELQDTAQLLGR